MSAGDYIRRSSLESRKLAQLIDSCRTLWGGTSTNSSNDFTVNLTVPVDALLTGTIIRWIPNASNTGASNLIVKDLNSITTLTTTAIKRADGSTALSSGDIVSGIPVETLYDGTVHRLLSSLTAGALTVATGTYTPTLTNTTNLSASTAYVAQYMRVGSVVTVGGRVDIDPTAAGLCLLGISLPVASNFANNFECGGAASAISVAGQCAAIYADTTNDRASMSWTAVDTANQAMYFSFTYLII